MTNKQINPIVSIIAGNNTCWGEKCLSKYAVMFMPIIPIIRIINQ